MSRKVEFVVTKSDDCCIVWTFDSPVPIENFRAIKAGMWGAVSLTLDATLSEDRCPRTTWRS